MIQRLVAVGLRLGWRGSLDLGYGCSSSQATALIPPAAPRAADGSSQELHTIFNVVASHRPTRPTLRRVVAGSMLATQRPFAGVSHPVANVGASVACRGPFRSDWS